MIIKHPLQLQTVLDWLDKQDEVAFDTETNGLSPRKNIVIGIALGNKTEGFYLVHKHLEAGDYREYLTKENLKPIFDKLLNKRLLTFNGSFDVRMCRGYFAIDFAGALYSEAQLARHTADENLSPWKSLKEIGMDLFGLEAGQEQRDLLESIVKNGGSKGQVWLAELDIVAKYAVQDVILTAKVEAHYRKSLIEQGLWHFYQDVEVMPLYRNVTIDLEDAGLALDIPLMQQTLTEIKADIQQLDARIREQIKPWMNEFEAWYLGKSIAPKNSGDFAQAAAVYYGIDGIRTKSGSISLSKKALASMPDCLFKQFILGEARLPSEDVLAIQRTMRDKDDNFNLMSKDHWKRLFFDYIKETPLSVTEKKKEPQLDDDFLESVKHKYDFVPLLLDYNKLNKIKSTYIERFLDESEDGRFYGRFNQHTATSGRYSSDLQQLPSKKDEEKLSPLALKYTNMIRSFFTADAGKVLVGADYTSLEVVVFADDAGDESLLNMIRKKYDFYSQAAIDVWGLHEYSADKKAPNFLKDHKPNQRQAAKEFALGIRYGMGAYTLSGILDISEYEAKQIIEKYFSSYPKLKARMTQLTDMAKNYGRIVSKAGRIRHLPTLQKLHSAYGNQFDNALELWKKYHENPAKYREMKYLSSQYWNEMNNALNFPIQSMAASIVNAASIAINKQFKAEGLDAILVMNVHDELVAMTAVEQQERVREIMQMCMEQTTKLSVPLTAEPQIGFRYSEVK